MARVASENTLASCVAWCAGSRQLHAACGCCANLVPNALPPPRQLAYWVPTALAPCPTCRQAAFQRQRLAAAGGARHLIRHAAHH
jgi:hypothetical protein